MAALARKSQQTDDGDPVAMTPEGIARQIATREDPAQKGVWVVDHEEFRTWFPQAAKEVEKLVAEGFAYRPFDQLANFYCLTDEGMALARPTVA